MRRKESSLRGMRVPLLAVALLFAVAGSPVFGLAAGAAGEVAAGRCNSPAVCEEPSIVLFDQDGGREEADGDSVQRGDVSGESAKPRF